MKLIRLSKRVAVSMIVSACMFTLLACNPSNAFVLADTPDPTTTLATTASPSPMPTVEPTPEPRVISIDMNQSLKDDNTGGEIVFQNFTYTQNQNMVLTFTVLNHADYPIQLWYPIYANINGYGLLFTGNEQYDFCYEAEPNSESEIKLTATMDRTLDYMMNIKEIKSIQLNCTFVGKMGEFFQAISDEMINPDCPDDYVQSYNIPGDDVPLLIDPEYYTTGINNYIQIKSTYDDSEKRVYVVLIGTAIEPKSIVGQVADFGKAYLAIDGVVSPYDDDVYTPNGKEVYLPNNGYCVISFDVSRIPNFVYQKSRLVNCTPKVRQYDKL